MSIGSGLLYNTPYTIVTITGAVTDVTAGDFALGTHAGMTLATTRFDLDGVLDGIYYNSAAKTVQVQLTPEPTSLSIML